MRSTLLLIPAVIVASAATPASAEVLLTTEQAQQALFPGATFSPRFFDITPAQYAELKRNYNGGLNSNRVRAWRVSNGGWFIIDVVWGRDDYIYYAVGLTADGKVTGVEILECLEGYSGITNALWRQRFVGAKRGQYDPDRIPILSGATLSSQHVADGVQRVLVVLDLFLKGKG